MKINDILLVKRFNAGAYPTISPKKVSPKSADNTSIKDLAVGQLIKGLVSGFTNDGKVLLEVGEMTLAAKADIELSNGQSVWLEVKQAGSTLVLSPANQKVAAGNLLRFLFANSAALTEILPQLAVDPDNPGGAVGGSSDLAIISRLLASAVKQNADATNIMAQTSLLKLLPAADSADFTGSFKDEINAFLGKDAQHAGLKGGLDKLMHWLGSLHAINGQSPAAEQLPLFIFPCLLAMGKGWGEWMISFDEAERPENGKGAQYSLDFFLELSRLGDMHLHLTVSHGAVFGLVEVHDGEIADHIKGMLPGFINVLEDLGFAKVDIATRQTEENSLQALKVVLAKKAKLQSCNIVDLTA